jgi:hypothetical protein
MPFYPNPSCPRYSGKSQFKLQIFGFQTTDPNSIQNFLRGSQQSNGFFIHRSERKKLAAALRSAGKIDFIVIPSAARDLLFRQF